MKLAKTLRTLAFVFIALSLAFTGAPTAQAQTYARDGAQEASFLASLNAQRAARGVAPLQLSASMSQSAGSWTARMVDGTFLSHSSHMAGGVPQGWSKVGENVGRGRTVSTLTSAFMNSPGHARNVLDPAFTHVGIAVIVHPNGRVYTTHRFASLPAAAPAAPVVRATPTAPSAPVVTAVVAAPSAPVAPPTFTPPSVPVAPPAKAAPVSQWTAEQEARLALMIEMFGPGS